MGSRPSTFYFYDLETSGTRPRVDRIMQFAGLRTDENLQIVGDELCLDVALGDEVLPNPESILVTGITPQRTRSDGLDEWRAISEIDRQFREPGTCVVGFNNLRFDDEFVRHTLYRNLLDPYAREWRDGNSRWDLIDLVRATGALRPDGLSWPHHDGKPSFRLEAMTEANALLHEAAHDALSDVKATVALAVSLRRAQPKLFDYYLDHGNKTAIRRQLMPLGRNLLVHVSGMIPNDRHCCAPVVSVAEHPENGNSVVVVDLCGDVRPLLDLTVEQLRENLFGRESQSRPPLKEIRVNRCPFVAPIAVVRPHDAERLGWDLDEIQGRWRWIQRELPELGEKIAKVYERSDERRQGVDPDEALYDGFLGDGDRATSERLQRALRADLAWPDGLSFGDARLTVLAARLKARLRPADLEPHEHDAWRDYVAARLTETHPDRLTLTAFREEVRARLAATEDMRQRKLLDALDAYAVELSERVLR